MEPSNFLSATNFCNDQYIESTVNKMRDEMDPEVLSAYGKETFEKCLQDKKRDRSHSQMKVTPVIEAYANAILDVYPQKRYQIMNGYFKIRGFVYKHLPEMFYDWFY